jgi:ABC-type uncharacterized transport system permease subunit
MSNLPVYLITLLAYAALSVIFLRALFAGNAETLNRGFFGNAVLFPLVLHGYLLFDSLWFAGALNLGLVNALSLILWLTLLVYWLAHFFYPLASLKALVLPLAGAGAMLPLLFPGSRAMPQAASWAFDAHVLAAMLAYSLFTIAALHAGLMSLVESSLHRARLPILLRNLPPLLTMEKLLFRLIAAGFVLLTLTLISGWVFSEQIFGRAWQFNHKVLFGIISWAVFAVLLAGHRFYGWRGRTAVSWTMSGFGFLVLAYIGSKFVLEVILHR